MSMPFYVAPEQVMKDRADYARKGIARGRSLAAARLRRRHPHLRREPVEHPAQGQRDLRPHRLRRRRQYNEFDQLRIAGVRHADLKGYQFSREDVDARCLANQYAQILGQIFTHEMKPMEVEILVAEVGAEPGDDQLFHILYDGTVVDEDRFTVLGGEAEAIAERLEAAWQRRARPGRRARGRRHAPSPAPTARSTADDLEVAVLDRDTTRRAFRRIEGTALTELLPAPDEPVAEEEPPAPDESPPDS